MARKKSANLTDAELRLMDVVWEKGEATVSEVAEALLVMVLLYDEERNVIGAVGISGDTSDRDEECALAGLAAAGLKP